MLFPCCAYTALLKIVIASTNISFLIGCSWFHMSQLDNGDRSARLSLWNEGLADTSGIGADRSCSSRSVPHIVPSGGTRFAQRSRRPGDVVRVPPTLAFES